MTDILDKLPDEELPEEEHEALLLMCGHAIGPTLSPAAHAVLYATHKAMAKQQFALSGVPDYRQVAAAVLRAVNEFVRMDQPLGDSNVDAGVFTAHQTIYGYIDCIATELEAASND